jgi:hypothetical protein
MRIQPRRRPPTRPLPAIPLIHRPLRRSAAALGLAVALAALLLGATAPQAPARAHSAGCRHSTGSHHRHRGTCARSRHKSKKGRAGHHAKHAVHPAKRAGHPAGGNHGAGVRIKPRAVAGAGVAATVLARQVPASCEDGSAPVRVEDEVFECADGSEPHCEAGSSLALSPDGSSLLCSPDPLGGSGEASCEDGSSPPCGPETTLPACSNAARRLDASPPQPCEGAGGETGCEASSGAAGQGDPTLVCDAPAGEAGDASLGLNHASAGASSQEASGS